MQILFGLILQNFINGDEAELERDVCFFRAKLSPWRTMSLSNVVGYVTWHASIVVKMHALHGKTCKYRHALHCLSKIQFNITITNPLSYTCISLRSFLGLCSCDLLMYRWSSCIYFHEDVYRSKVFQNLIYVRHLGSCH